jgi:CHASE3 domain sensor protein
MMKAERVGATQELVSTRGARRTTPSRLRLASIGLAAVVLITGAVTVLAALERHSASSAAWQQSEPLVVKAQAIDTDLSDADTTAAGSFLLGQIEPSALRSRYDTDLARASQNLAGAAAQAGTDPVTSSAIRTVSVDVTVYSGLIQTAISDERQGYYPLAAAYLGEANNLMQATILPAAHRLYAVENQRLTGDLGSAQGSWLVVLAGVLVVLTVVLLVVVQVRMSRHFRRTFNLWLVAATAATFVLGVWFTAAVAVQSSGVNAATSGGSSPLVLFTEARIGALRVTADDELTLVTQDSEPQYQPDYRATVHWLTRLLDSAASGAGRVERAEIAHSLQAVAGYSHVHGQIRRLDGTGRPNQEQKADADAATFLPAVSATLDEDLATAIGTSQHAFEQSMSGSTTDIGALVGAAAVLSVVAAVLVLMGFRARIAEYR